MLLLRLVLIVPLAQVAPFMMPSLGDMWKIAKFGMEVGSKIKAGYDFIEGLNDDTSERIDKILDQVAEISNKIDGFESRLDQRLDVIVETLVSRITLIQKLDNTFLELHKIIVDVDHLWDNYMKYSQNRENFNSNTLKSFIKLATGDQQGGLQKLLNQMHRLVVPLRTQHIRDSLFLTMLKYERETELITCDEPISHQQAIYQIYYSVALTELRGFVMAAYAYGLRPKYENGKYTEEVNSLEARFTMRSRDYLVATKEAMKIASNRIRRCDPKGGHKKGISFVEMDELFQTYIINEADIHPDDSCKETCGSIGTQTYRRKTDSYVNYNYDRPCWGTIRDCRYGGGKMTVCDTRYVTNNSRRYYWFKEDDGTVSGDNSVGCPGQTNWPKGWIRGFYKCDYCICTCEADRKFSRGKRAISFLPSRSDAVNNMVVTGVRVVQKEKMILIQVREGKLQPQGTILKGSDRWVPLPEFQYAQLGSAGGYYLMRGAKKALQVQGRDFEFFKGDKKTVNLDDVSGPPGHVVIGVRFQQAKDAKITKDNPIRLEVLAVPFDFEEGKVTPSRWKPAKWIGVEDNKKRTQVKFNEPDVPTKHGQNLPTLAPNLYVNFQASDLKKDAGQSTIPFWDIQDVITIPSFALQGVGIFHKGHRDGLYGGYLALRLLSLEFADNLNTTVPQDLQNAYEQIYRAPLYTPTGVL
ncbi:uncharacterized protein LOC107038021 [Diachasma alloeum]|uniref:uncharacterized protein LOC107038021 n=1 Tax=Diachasma alloeum TaxID=454923 RepID=UPI0007384B99|nr:uncharacterized protein LOC107038021 [Diachasma alloeum]